MLEKFAKHFVNKLEIKKKIVQWKTLLRKAASFAVNLWAHFATNLPAPRHFQKEVSTLSLVTFTNLHDLF